MCGIIGFVGHTQAVPILVEGLKRLEYRGYDSAGLAIIDRDGLICQKMAGKVADLESVLNGKDYQATVGIAHTRWATHGEPTDENAHPHVDCRGEIAVVHNGIIENYKALRELLKREGHEFRTDTDTEILAHLIEKHYHGDLVEATRIALAQVEGTYGIAVLCKHHPREIVAARKGSPLVVGSGEKENFIASDVAALLRHTNQVVYLEDGEMAVIGDENFSVITTDKARIIPQLQEISWDLDMIEKDGYAHFMLKEIFEQPVTMSNAMRGRLNEEEGTARLNGLRHHYKELCHVNRIIITACGTSWHASLVGEYMIEDLARIPVEVEYASELRYRSPIIDDRMVLLAISQSGETADTLAAMREAQRKGATALGICNVVGSTIARESDGGVYIHAGPEIGVASTKAFTSQLVVLALTTLLLGRMRNISVKQGKEMIQAIKQIPHKVEQILKKEEQIKELAARFYQASNFLYLGRGYNFPVALEGALKLKEISYVHAEGYAAAEMKHGPIALIDEQMPVVVLATKDSVYNKVLSNIQEVKARHGVVIAVATEGDEDIRDIVDYIFYVPETMDFLIPLLTVIPLQLLAYHIAVLRGCPVDQPRNLAKSVTVE